jgi:hypothetical protein
MPGKDTEMKAATAAYPGTHTRIRLIAAVLALAGSGLMVGGNLGIAAYYAANAGNAEPRLARHNDTPHQVARNKCANNAS